MFCYDFLQGAEIDVRSIVVGDETMSVLEIWGAEYQEQVGGDFMCIGILLLMLYVCYFLYCRFGNIFTCAI